MLNLFYRTCSITPIKKSVTLSRPHLSILSLGKLCMNMRDINILIYTKCEGVAQFIAIFFAITKLALNRERLGIIR